MNLLTKCRHLHQAVDVDSEPEYVKNLYGMDGTNTEDFGRKCLLARRLVERGVRFIQIYSGGHHNDNNWDAHGDLVKNHSYHAGNTDKPIAGLLKDLKQRGLLDETLVVWGGEFGRQPTAEYKKGLVETITPMGLPCGWRVRHQGGISVGETDELGSQGNRPLSCQATTCNNPESIGLDPNNLTYFHGGLDRALVGLRVLNHYQVIV